MADNTIIVSAIDRSKVQVNVLNGVDREKCILALSVGDEYQHLNSSADLKFFFDIVVAYNGALLGVAAFTVFAYGLFLASFWESSSTQGALIIVAASIIAFFCLNPYLLALVDWRNFMSEEAEALLHSSNTTNKALKSMLTLTLILIVSLVITFRFSRHRECGVHTMTMPESMVEDFYFWQKHPSSDWEQQLQRLEVENRRRDAQ
jgi:hypothetical protein